jgi:hypothetical protein
MLSISCISCYTPILSHKNSINMYLHTLKKTDWKRWIVFHSSLRYLASHVALYIVRQMWLSYRWTSVYPPHPKGLKFRKTFKSSIFWDITPCIPLKVDWRFGGKCRLHLQSRSINKPKKKPAWKQVASRHLSQISHCGIALVGERLRYKLKKKTVKAIPVTTSRGGP